MEDTEGDKIKIWVKLSCDGGKTFAHAMPLEQLLGGGEDPLGEGWIRDDADPGR